MSERGEKPPYLRGRAERSAAEGRADASESASREGETAETVYSVTGLTQQIQGLLGRVGRVCVQGEVSRIVRAASGHVYFDLKDAGAKIACVVWRSQAARAVPAELAEGLQAVAHGALDVYAPRGGYSLVVDSLRPAGAGVLLARLEELKRELAARGWFDRQRPLPRLPRVVGVVTSRDGAAFRDFLRTRSLRWPGYPVRLIHTPVQGPGAAESIAAAIGALDASGVDVIVVCRGGGSLEDLWAFNELAVASAIFAASVPVVAGIGHESDVTLADWVADWRAHTPTDAAQTVIPERAELRARLARAANYLAAAMDARLGERERTLARLARARALRDPRALLAARARELERMASGGSRALARLLERAERRCGDLRHRLEAQNPVRQIERRDRRLEALGARLAELGREPVRRRAERLAVCAARLQSISPLAVLARGFSLTTRAADDAPIRSSRDVRLGELVRIRLAAGALVARVSEVSPPPGELPFADPDLAGAPG